MEVIVHPKSLLSRDYVSEFYKPHLEEVCKYFKCINIISSVTIGHSLFYKLISNSDLQKKYESYWFRKKRWDPLGVIESFMNPQFQLTDNMTDFAWVLAKIGLLRFSQSDTERVNKTVDKIERRFTNFNESHEGDGKRDRTKEEVFPHANRIAMDELPLEEINKLYGLKCIALL